MNGALRSEEAHLTERTYQRLLAHELASDERAAVEAHVADCASCRHLVAAGLAAEPESLVLPLLEELTGSGAATRPEGRRTPGASRAPALPRPEVPPGPLKLGRYVVEALLGQGGMGRVYLAHDPDLDRKVALKLLLPESAADGASRARLLREAQAMARLADPHTVAVHDVGSHEGKVFVAMEYVPSSTLDAWLRAPRSFPQKLELFLQAGRGLLAAHRAGMVHRDFKPQNVLVGHDGKARVTDFGLARPAHESTVALKRELDVAATSSLLSPLTQTGVFLGTPAYMAPEQIRGEATDARSDQFSFCVALYEGCYGRRPFTARTFQALGLELQRGAVPPPPPGTSAPEALWPLLRRGLSVQPGDRFASIEELLGALEALRASAEEGDRVPAQSRMTRRAGQAAGAVVVMVAVVLVAWVAQERWLSGREGPLPTGPHAIALGAPRERGDGARAPAPGAVAEPPAAAADLAEAPPPLANSALGLQAQPATHEAHLDPVPARSRRRPATLRLTTQPPTEVFLGPRLLGRTPLTVTLPPGDVALRLRNRAEQLDQRVPLELVAGETLERSIGFRKGTLSVNSTPGADLFLNDSPRKLNSTPMFGRALYEGRYTLRLINAELGLSRTLRVEIRPGEETRINERLE